MKFPWEGRGAQGETGRGKEKKPLPDNAFKMVSKFRDSLGRSNPNLIHTWF